MSKRYREVEQQYAAFAHSEAVQSLNEQSVCIDCGANVGDVTAIFAEKGATVYAFEPSSIPFKKLSARFADNPKVHLFQQAVGTAPGRTTLYFEPYHDQCDVYGKYQGMGSTIREVVDGNHHSNFKEDVDVIDLCEFIVSINQPIAILKIDVMGGECPILEKLITSGLYKNVQHIISARYGNTPEIIANMRRIEALIAELNIKNIDLTWHATLSR